MGRPGGTARDPAAGVGADRGRAGLSPHAPGALRGLLALAALVLTSACSPIYLIRAGWAELGILSARRPIADVIRDPEADPDTRGKLSLALEARRFAIDSLELRAGDSYTTFTRLRRDTLALVLSAAPMDRLEPRTWWFPVVGHLPYRAYFDDEDARREEASLRDEGYDTYLRPTAAFSTLGWFSDPLLSTLLAFDHVGLVETVLHELAHNHLYLPGRTRFNESFATFVGAAGAARFFCNRRGGGPDTVWCHRSRARWADDQRFSRYLDELTGRLEALYDVSGRPREEVLRRREEIFFDARESFREQVLPTLRQKTFRAFQETPLNNATLLARMRYYHRLGDFQAHLEENGGALAAAIRALAEEAPGRSDPFDLLPRATSPPEFAGPTDGGPERPDAALGERPFR